MTLKFTINKDTWLRGEGSDRSRLLRIDDGKMCCLGQILSQAGVQPAEMENTREPNEIAACEIDADVRALLIMSGQDEDGEAIDIDTVLTSEAMTINDYEGGTNKERIEKLTALFAAEGVELEFI